MKETKPKTLKKEDQLSEHNVVFNILISNDYVFINSLGDEVLTVTNDDGETFYTVHTSLKNALVYEGDCEIERFKIRDFLDQIIDNISNKYVDGLVFDPFEETNVNIYGDDLVRLREALFDLNRKNQVKLKNPKNQKLMNNIGIKPIFKII